LISGDKIGSEWTLGKDLRNKWMTMDPYKSKSNVEPINIKIKVGFILCDKLLEFSYVNVIYFF